MEKVLFKNEIVNTVLGILLIAFAITVYFTGWINEFFGIIIGIVVILFSGKRFFETFKSVKKKEAVVVLVLEIIADLVCAFMLITSKGTIGLYVGIVIYIRGFAYLLINYLASRKGNIFQYFLNIGFVTLGSYLMFGGNTYLNVLEVIIVVMIGLIGLLYAFFGIREIIEKSKKKPKKIKQPAEKKESVIVQEVKPVEKKTEKPLASDEKLSMTEAVKKAIPSKDEDKPVVEITEEPLVVTPKPTPLDYEKMTVAELKELCKKQGLTNYASLRKNELIELLK